MSIDERKQVEDENFGSLLELQLDIVVKRQATEWLLDNSSIEQDRILMNIKPGVIFEITTSEIYRHTRLMCCTCADTCVVQQVSLRESYQKLRSQLNAHRNDSTKCSLNKEKGSCTCEILVEQDLQTMGKSQHSSLKLRCFFFVAIGSFLLPNTSTFKKINSTAVKYTHDLSIIGKINWCNIIYERFEKRC